MPSRELQLAIEAGKGDVVISGAANGHFDLAGYRSTVRPAKPNALPAGTEIVDAVANGVPGKWFLAPGTNYSHRILYFHGGGYVAGGWQSHRGIAGMLSQKTGYAVFLPEYRLAPEHRYPAAHEDAFAAFEWIFTAGPEPVVDVVIAGDSAGGGLALATLLNARDSGHRMASAAVLLAPYTSLDPMRSAVLRRSGFLSGFAQQYAPEHLDDPLVSPSYADLAGLPATLIQVGTLDPFLEDIELLAAAATKAGNCVRLSTWDGCPHVWHKLLPDVPEAVDAFAEIAEFLKSARERFRVTHAPVMSARVDSR